MVLTKIKIFDIISPANCKTAKGFSKRRKVNKSDHYCIQAIACSRKKVGCESNPGNLSSPPVQKERFYIYSLSTHPAWCNTSSP